MSKKICIIGAGSAIFSLNLIKDICVNKNFNNCTVYNVGLFDKEGTIRFGLKIKNAGTSCEDIIKDREENFEIA